jgi:hypothetical protein
MIDVSGTIDYIDAELAWCRDILKRIQELLNSTTATDAEKVEACKWLAKQGLKGEREE